MRLHHAGIAVTSIAIDGRAYCADLGIPMPGSPIVDQAQGVSVAFANVGNDLAIEFVEPLGPDSPIKQVLNRGGGLYHLCFEVADLVQAITRVRDRGGLLVGAPTEAPAFGGRRVAFVYTATRNLVEFVESGDGN